MFCQSILPRIAFGFAIEKADLHMPPVTTATKRQHCLRQEDFALVIDSIYLKAFPNNGFRLN